jgi:hypothetical protein
MKKFILSLLLALALMVPSAKAQTRVLLGLSGSNEFNNMSAGVSAGLEVPFLHRFELDLNDTYSPYETHVGLGIGHANIASAGGTVWLTDKVGLSGKLEDSGYSVTKVSKTAAYALAGATVKTYVLGFPSRVSFGYTQQFNNGITNGVETSHLTGGYIKVDTRLGCTGAVCYRGSEQFAAGHVLQQGNPVCDGTEGAVTCPRNTSFGVGVSLTFSIEFPRRRTTEDNLF